MIDTEMTTEVEVEETADQQDAFLTGWDDEESFAEAADQPMEQEEQEEPNDLPQVEPPKGDSPSEADENPDAPDAETPDSGAPETSDQPEQHNAATWTVKHMDQTRTISAEEITPEWLQKGLDYDRIRGKYDEAKPVMEMFGRFAAQAGMSIPDYVKLIRAEAKKASGMSETEARKAVELEDREAAVSAKEAQQRETADKKETSRARIENDLAEFGKAFPDVYKQAKSDRTVIPDAVWNDVQSGMSLTAAYARYAVAESKRMAQEAAQRAEVAEKNQRNASRASKSMRSVGSGDLMKDAFLEGWGS